MQRKLVSLHTDKEQATEMKLVDVSNKPDWSVLFVSPLPGVCIFVGIHACLLFLELKAVKKKLATHEHIYHIL
jgi:hypothetical protein